ncbi:hypothetical protein HD554DRAFT_2173191 [Boletus coccyginus]|nr:hypothetical protein HD554DRAFT_2173191 [Boletus coccyginus]
MCLPVERLHSRAESLVAEFKQGRGRSCIEGAIDLDREALQLCPPDHPKRSLSVTYLTLHLRDRCNQFRAASDFEEAIILALNLFPEGHPDRSGFLNNLAVDLSTRYNQFWRMEDLDEAIVLVREALGLRPKGHPDQSGSLNNLAVHLSSWYKQLGGMEDLDVAIVLNREALDLCPQGHPDWPTSLNNLANHLYNRFTYLRQWKDKEEVFGLYTQLAHVPQTVSTTHPPHAVELLEQGCNAPRLKILSYVSGPAGWTLADEFMRLALLICNTIGSPGADQHQHLCHLNLKMERAVINMRELPGLSRFLLPALFPDLQRVASGDRSSSSMRASIAITQETVRDLSTELHTLTVRARRVDVTRELGALLCKLWDQIISPIVDFLWSTYPSRSRIWWCPTAEFSVLPLHAAGPYRKGEQNLPDIYNLSYTPTLSALIRAKWRDPSSPAAQQKRFIAIGQAKAVGESELVSVSAELDNIGRSVDGLATFTRVDGEESCIFRVVEELGKNDWVPLACHGLPNPKNPFRVRICSVQRTLYDSTHY